MSVKIHRSCPIVSNSYKKRLSYRNRESIIQQGMLSIGSLQDRAKNRPSICHAANEKGTKQILSVGWKKGRANSLLLLRKFWLPLHPCFCSSHRGSRICSETRKMLQSILQSRYAIWGALLCDLHTLDQTTYKIQSPRSQDKRIKSVKHSPREGTCTEHDTEQPFPLP